MAVVALTASQVRAQDEAPGAVHVRGPVGRRAARGCLRGRCPADRSLSTIVAKTPVTERPVWTRWRRGSSRSSRWPASNGSSTATWRAAIGCSRHASRRADRRRARRSARQRCALSRGRSPSCSTASSSTTGCATPTGWPTWRSSRWISSTSGESTSHSGLSRGPAGSRPTTRRRRSRTTTSSTGPTSRAKVACLRATARGSRPRDRVAAGEEA